MPDQTSHGPDGQDPGSGEPQDRKPRRWTIKSELLAGIGSLLVGIAAVLALFVHNVQQDKASSSTTEARPPTTSTQTTNPAGPATSAQPTASAEASTQYLADLQPLSGGTLNTTPHDIRGTTYLHSISAQTGGCAANQKAAFVYNLGTQFRAFDAVVGLSDQSTDAARVEVRVIADNVSLFTGIVRVGYPKTVHVPVTGKLHMTLQQTYLGPNPNLCSDAGEVVWADARLSQ